MDPARLNGLSGRLLPWYREHCRPLPWRADPSPYRVWVSEIMLQQTRIEAVRPYYERFMQRLPSPAELAAAPADELYKLWEGLGYYSRVRNLQKAAVQLVECFGGQLPDRYEQLVRLPGIGPYTAGAIASIAFGQRVAAVDGNVLRVLARLTGYTGDVTAPAGKKELSALAQELVPEKEPGLFNQAVMELGETVCLPGAAVRCGECPLGALCAAREQGIAPSLPVRGAKAPRRVEEKTVLAVLTVGEPPRLLLHRRSDTGLLAGMWELPQLEAAEQLPDFLRRCGAAALSQRPLPASHHLFTHIEWRMTGLAVWVRPFAPPEGYRLVTAEQLEDTYALPSAFRFYQRTVPALMRERPDGEEAT